MSKEEEKEKKELIMREAMADLRANAPSIENDVDKLSYLADAIKRSIRKHTATTPEMSYDGHVIQHKGKPC